MSSRLTLVTQISRLVATVFVLSAAVWSFAAGFCYDAWLLATMSTLGALYLILSAIPFITRRPRFANAFAALNSSALRQGIFVIFLGLMSIRDHYLGAYGIFCIVMGSLTASIGGLHIIAWLFVFRKEERIQAQAVATVPPVLSMGAYEEDGTSHGGDTAIRASFEPDEEQSTRRALETQLRQEAEVEARRQIEEEDRLMAAEIARRTALAAAAAAEEEAQRAHAAAAERRKQERRDAAARVQKEQGARLAEAREMATAEETRMRAAALTEMSSPSMLGAASPSAVAAITADRYAAIGDDDDAAPAEPRSRRTEKQQAPTARARPAAVEPAQEPPAVMGSGYSALGDEPSVDAAPWRTNEAADPLQSAPPPARSKPSRKPAAKPASTRSGWGEVPDDAADADEVPSAGFVAPRAAAPVPAPSAGGRRSGARGQGGAAPKSTAAPPPPTASYQSLDDPDFD